MIHDDEHIANAECTPRPRKLTGDVPSQWLRVLPDTLVVGNGSLASALTSVLFAEILSLDALEAGPAADVRGQYPQVLGVLQRALIVVSGSMSASDALRCRDAVWRWIEKLAPAGDQQELALVFVLPPDATQEFERALAAGLGLTAMELPSMGHGVWRTSDSLQGLLELLGRVRPLDLLPLRSRQREDAKHVALAMLLEEASEADAVRVREAASAVLREFAEGEYMLDAFCRQPSHQHGNLLRTWLHSVATGSVTPDRNNDKQLLDLWLA